MKEVCLALRAQEEILAGAPLLQRKGCLFGGLISPTLLFDPGLSYVCELADNDH